LFWQESSVSDGVEEENRMNKMTMALLGWLFISAGPLVWHGWAQGADTPPPEGGVLPDMILAIPAQLEEQKYLGVEGTGTFKLPWIRAKVVIIEVFSMYCPFCQKEAPNVNELFRSIDQDKDLQDKVKLIGIGAGNSPFEVDTFRNAYKVPFPLVADPDFAFHNVLGKVRTPYFLVIAISEDGSHKVVYSKVGSFGEPRDFLQLIGRQAGIKKGT
jgi:peroxiredoxin